MPFDFYIADGGEGVVYSGSGVVTGVEVRETVKSVIHNERLELIRYSLIDLTRAVDVRISTEDLRFIAEMAMDARREHARRCLAIASADPLAFGLGRMYTAFVDNTEWAMAVVKTVAEAREFISEQLGKPTLSFE